MKNREKIAVCFAFFFFSGTLTCYGIEHYIPLVVTLSPDLSLDSKGLPIITQVATMLILGISLFLLLFFTGILSLGIYHLISEKEWQPSSSS